MNFEQFNDYFKGRDYDVFNWWELLKQKTEKSNLKMENKDTPRWTDSEISTDMY